MFWAGHSTNLNPTNCDLVEQLLDQSRMIEPGCWCHRTSQRASQDVRPQCASHIARFQRRKGLPTRADGIRVCIINGLCRIMRVLFCIVRVSWCIMLGLHCIVHVSCCIMHGSYCVMRVLRAYYTVICVYYVCILCYTILEQSDLNRQIRVFLSDPSNSTTLIWLVRLELSN